MIDSKDLTEGKLVKILCLLTLVCFSFSSKASLKKMTQEYLENNSGVLKSKAKADSSFLGISSYKAQKTWSLSYSGSKEKDNLETVSAFSTRDTSTTNHSLSVAKDFNWGGEFSINNSLLKYNSPSLANPTNGFGQGLSYTQDLGANFLGRSYYSGLESIEEDYNSTKASIDNALQSSLYSFAVSYSQAKLNFSLLKLQEAARDRAKRRKELIRRRVRDGLKEKVDLIQARIELLSSEEQVKSAEMQRKSSLETLSNALHRNVNRIEVDPFDAKELDLNSIPAGTSAGNLEIQSLESKLKSLRSTKDQVDYSFWPTINAGITYNTNDFDNQKSTALDEGSLIGSRKADETVLSLNVVWSIGSESQKVSRALNNIDLRVTEMETKKLKLNFLKTEESLLTQLELLEKNLVSVKQRKELTKSALNEMTKLYNRGRADLDQVIRAEESLINTERNFIQYLAQRENLVYRLASLYGTLEEYLTK
ncbi:MAG: outer membrane protein TolC [Bacteriovoracaceae bacterium]|jgi:outer membrane protein TolC